MKAIDFLRKEDPDTIPLASETNFQQWYGDISKKYGLNPNPDDPRHYYDYRAAFKAGAKPDEAGHWPSEFKLKGHPRMIVNDVNTKTGQKIPLAKDFLYEHEPGVGLRPAKEPFKESPGLKAWKELKAEAPEILGATAGAIILSPAGIPGMVGGAAMGGAAGRAYKQIYQYKFSPTKSPKTSWEAAKEIGKAGAEQGAYELLGGAVAAGVTKTLAPFRSSITAEGRIALDTLNKYMPRGKLGIRRQGLLPAEVTENRWLDIMHNIGEASIFGGSRISKFKTGERALGITNMLDDMSSLFSKAADADDLGNAVVATIENRWKDYRKAVTDPIYNKIDQLTKATIQDRLISKQVDTGLVSARGSALMKEVREKVAEEIYPVNVSMEELKTFTMPLKKQIDKLGGIDAVYAGDEIVRAVQGLPDTIDFLTAKNLRSRLIDMGSDFKANNPRAPAIGIIKQLTKKLDNAVSKQLTEVQPETLVLWRQANELYEAGTAKYNNYFLRKLISLADPRKGNEPEKIVSQIFRKKGISGIRKMKNVAGEGLWGKLQGWYLGDLIAQSTNQKTGELLGANLISNMYGKAGMGTKQMHAIFSPEQLKSLDHVATTLKVIQERQGEGTGKIFIQLQQAAAVAGGISALTGFGGRPVQTTAGIILVGPYVLARMMVNPVTARWLTTGIKIPVQSQLFASTALRISDAADKAKSWWELMAD